MTGEGVLLVLGDGVVVHAGEEIVGMVVLAHVGEAEPPVFILACRVPWARDAAPAPCSPATRRPDAVLAQPAILVGLDPDAVEQRRCGDSFFMTDHYAACGALTFKS